MVAMKNLVAFASANQLVPIEPQEGLERYNRLSRIAGIVLLVLLLLMATVFQLTSAVAAFGDVTVDSKVKKLTHPTGGVVSAVLVRDGDKVKKGQVLMRFDTTVSGVSAEVSGKNLDQLMAMQARLQAERDSRAGITFPPDLLNSKTPSAQIAMNEERRMFALRASARAGQRVQLAERIAQAEQQIASFQTQIGASNQQSTLIAPELSGMRQLYAKKLTTINRVNELERTAVALTANAASLQAQIAQARAQISEFRQQIIQLDQDARSQAGTELAQITAQVAEQQVRKATAGDMFDRSAIRAPQSGTVDKLAYTTIGSAVPPQQTIMEIVPDTDALTVEAKISPNDIDQVHAGQQTELRFTAFNVRTTPQIKGVLRRASAERQTDERTGSSYYTVLIDIAPGEIKKLGGLQLVPGMPVEAYIQTGRRSMLSYLLKPIADQFKRSFRQE
jgi:HlyD family secretion protein